MNLTLKQAEIQHNLCNYSEAIELYKELANSKEFSLLSQYRVAALQKLLAPNKSHSGYVLVWQTGVHDKGSIVRRLVRHFPIIAEVDDSSQEVPFQHRYSKIYDKMIVVDHRINSIESLQYYLNCKLAGSDLVLIHLADENFADFHEVYNLCRIVYRNYWGGLLATNRKVHFFPLGDDTSEIYPEIKRSRSVSEREFDWNFLGDDTKQDRRVALQHFGGIGKSKQHCVSGFFDSRKLGPEEYRSILANSKFTLCPMGYSNADTFRFWEAIEFGSIPIFAKENNSYFSRLIGTPLPFPVFKTWEKAVEWVRCMLNCPEILEEMRVEMLDWWKDYKNNLSIDFIKNFEAAESLSLS